MAPPRAEAASAWDGSPASQVCMKMPMTRSPGLTRLTPGRRFDNLPGAVGQRDERQLHAPAAAVLDGHQVAVVSATPPRTRTRASPGCRAASGPLRRLQVVDAEGVAKFKDFHDRWFLLWLGLGGSCRAQIVAQPRRVLHGVLS